MTARGAKEIVIGSNDGRMFLEPIREIVSAGTRVVVVGFTEFAGSSPSPTLGSSSIWTTSRNC